MRMMERKIARDFQASVRSLLEDDDPETIYATLKAFHQSKDVKWLVDRLITVVDRPSRRPLFDQVRKLIPTKLQISFDALLPHAATAVEARIRVIRIAPKTSNQPLGFSVRGGFEHGIGFYVSEVEKGSTASQRGLCPGDQIIRVNGFCIDECILSEVLQLIKLKSQLVLKVVTVGMIPVKDNVGDPVTWRYTDQERKGDVLWRGDVDDDEAILPRMESTDDRKDNSPLFRMIRVFIHKPENVTLGCSIYCGSESSPGIFVQSIRIGSLAEEVGLDVDDEIVSVNGAHFRQCRHSEAVVNLKTPLQLDMVVRRKAKDPSTASASPTFMENIRQLESERVAELRLLAADVSAETERRRHLRSIDDDGVDDDVESAEARRLKEQFEEQRWIEREEKRLKKIDSEKADLEEKRRLKKEDEDRKILDRMEAVLDGGARPVASEDDDGKDSGAHSDNVEALELVMNFDTEREDERSVIHEKAIVRNVASSSVGAASPLPAGAASPPVSRTAISSGAQPVDGPPRLPPSSPPSTINVSPPPSPDSPPLRPEKKPSRKNKTNIPPSDDSSSPFSSLSSDAEAGSELSSTTIPKRPARGAFESHSLQMHRFLQTAGSKPGVDDDSGEWLNVEDVKGDSAIEEIHETGNENTKRVRKRTEVAQPSPLNPPPRQKKVSAEKRGKPQSNSTTSVLPPSSPTTVDSAGSSRRPTLEELTSVKLRPTSKGTPVKTEHVRRASNGSDNKASLVSAAPSATAAPSVTAAPSSTASTPSTTTTKAPTVKRQPSIPVTQGPAFSSTQRPVLVSPQATGGETPRGATTPAAAAAPVVGTGSDSNNTKRQAPEPTDEAIARKSTEKPPEKSPRKARRKSTTSPRSNAVNGADAIPETNIDGREIKVVTIAKGDDPLDVTIEGGTGSPWDGVIVVSRVWEGGAVDKNGAIKTGDQLLMVEGESLNGISLAEAQSAIKSAMRSAKDSISFVVAVAEDNRKEVKL